MITSITCTMTCLVDWHEVIASLEAYRYPLQYVLAYLTFGLTFSVTHLSIRTKAFNVYTVSPAPILHSMRTYIGARPHPYMFKGGAVRAFSNLTPITIALDKKPRRLPSLDRLRKSRQCHGYGVKEVFQTSSCRFGNIWKQGKSFAVLS